MSISYTPTTWVDLPTKTSPINATNLNKIEQGIVNATTEINNVSEDVATLQTEVSSFGNGTPPTAQSTSEMDHSVSTVYINTTDGNWYYYDGSDWQVGGVYGGAVTDTTLSVSGAAADAKAVGDAIGEVNDQLEQLVGVPATAKQALLLILQSVAAYNDTDGLDDAMTVIEEWASTTCTAITLSALSLTFTSATTQTLTATLTPSDCEDIVTWASSDTSVATVSSTGIVSAVGNGSCTIYASVGNIIASCSVTVSGISAVYAVTYSLTNCTSSNSDSVVTGGESYTTTLTSSNSMPVTSDTITCTDSSVVITDNSDGTATITISAVSEAFSITAEPAAVIKWDYTAGELPTDGDYGISDTTNSTAMTAEYDSTNGIVITAGSGAANSTYIRYYPTDYSTATRSEIEANITFLSSSTINGACSGVFLTVDGTSCADVFMAYDRSDGYYLGYRISSSPVVIQTISTDTEYTLKIVYDSTSGYEVYLDGSLVFTGTTFRSSSNRFNMLHSVGANVYIKSMMWKIYEV